MIRAVETIFLFYVKDILGQASCDRLLSFKELNFKMFKLATSTFDQKYSASKIKCSKISATKIFNFSFISFFLDRLRRLFFKGGTQALLLY